MINLKVKPLKTLEQLTALTQFLRTHPNSRVAQLLVDDFNYVFEYGTEPPVDNILQQQQQRSGVSALTRRGVGGAARASAFLAMALGSIVGYALVVDVENVERLAEHYEVER